MAGVRMPSPAAVLGYEPRVHITPRCYQAPSRSPMSVCPQIDGASRYSGVSRKIGHFLGEMGLAMENSRAFA